MVLQLPCLIGDFAALGHRQNLTLHIQHVTQTKADLHASDPLVGAYEALRLVTHVHQGLLNVAMLWHRFLCERLQFVPGEYGLEGSVSAAPAIVVEIVLHVVEVNVVSLDQRLLSILDLKRFDFKVSYHCRFWIEKSAKGVQLLLKVTVTSICVYNYSN